MIFWRLLRANFKIDIAANMIYRFNFLIYLSAGLLFDILAPVFSIIIYSVSKGIPGWSFEQFILFQGTYLFAFGFSAAFFHPTAWRTADLVRNGLFNRILLKPIGPLRNLLSRTDINESSGMVVGALLITYALTKLPAPPLGNILLYVSAIGLSLVFLYALAVLTAAISFVAVQSGGLWSLFDALLDLGTIPTSLYGKVGLRLMTYLFPIGLAAFYPASMLFGEGDIFILIKLTIVVLAFLAFSVSLFTYLMRRHSSAGG